MEAYSQTLHGVNERSGENERQSENGNEMKNTIHKQDW